MQISQHTTAHTGFRREGSKTRATTPVQQNPHTTARKEESQNAKQSHLAYVVCGQCFPEWPQPSLPRGWFFMYPAALRRHLAVSILGENDPHVFPKSHTLPARNSLFEDLLVLPTWPKTPRHFSRDNCFLSDFSTASLRASVPSSFALPRVPLRGSSSQSCRPSQISSAMPSLLEPMSLKKRALDSLVAMRRG